MKSRRRSTLAGLLLGGILLLASCNFPGSAPPNSTGPEPSRRLTEVTAEPEPGETPDDVKPTATQDGEQVSVTADRDEVNTITLEGDTQALPAPQQTLLSVGEAVGVGEQGRAILRFSDLLTVELLRAGELQLQEVDISEQSAFVTVLQNGGVLVNDFNPQEEIERRFTVQTQFATITATGTRFLVVREQGSPLEWVVGFDSEEGDLQVTAAGITKDVVSNQARWIAPLDEPSAGIPAEMGNVLAWVDNLQAGARVPEVGDTIWAPADVLISTGPLPELPAPDVPFQLGDITLTLTPGGDYSLEDCNGDDITDIAITLGSLQFDFRTVLNRVRALDVTVLNRSESGMGFLRVLDPAKEEISRETVTAARGETQILSQRADTPYHYAELGMESGCFLGLSLTPPGENGEAGQPRSPIDPTPDPEIGDLERPPANGMMSAVSLIPAGYTSEIPIKADADFWLKIQELTGAEWTDMRAIIYDPNCAARYPGVASPPAIDLLGKVLFAYNESFLFVAFSVEDEGFEPYNGRDERYFLGDAPQLSLDLDLQSDFTTQKLSPDDIQVDFLPGRRVPGDRPAVALWQLDKATSRVFTEALVAARATDTGYFLDAALPWESLGVKPQPGLKFGIAASLSDNDTPGTDVQECMISTAPERNWRDPTTWGTLVLMP